MITDKCRLKTYYPLANVVANGYSNATVVLRVKNHDFMSKNHIFFSIAERGAKFFGLFRVNFSL
jgi:hypothetical protein